MPACPDCGGVMISDEPRMVRGTWMVPLDCIECGSGIYVPYEGEA